MTQTDCTYVKRSDTDEFSVAGVLVVVRHGPLEWKEVVVVDLEVVVSVPGDRLLLGETDAAVLERREDGRRDVVVVTLHRHHHTPQPD